MHKTREIEQRSRDDSSAHVFQLVEKIVKRAKKKVQQNNYRTQLDYRQSRLRFIASSAEYGSSNTCNIGETQMPYQNASR